MTDSIQWPNLPDITKTDDPLTNAKLELFKAKLEVIKANHLAGLEAEKVHAQKIVDQQKAGYEGEYATFLEVYKGYLDVAKGQLDRSFQRADFIQKVAAAVGTAYTGILALSFAADQTRLPSTGIAPALFLALSFVLAAVYLAYLSAPSDVEETTIGHTLREAQIARRNNFILWTRSSVMKRKYFLQASVLSLGFGVFLLPAPYLDPIFVQRLAIVALVITLLGPFVVEFATAFARRSTNA